MEEPAPPGVNSGGGGSEEQSVVQQIVAIARIASTFLTILMVHHQLKFSPTPGVSYRWLTWRRLSSLLSRDFRNGPVFPGISACSAGVETCPPRSPPSPPCLSRLTL